MPNVKQTPASQTPPPKEVIAPPPPVAGPMHKHTGFIIAIVLTSLLLVGAAVMAYLSWDNGAKLANENRSLSETVISFQSQNEQLQEALDEEMERPGPTPFYHAVFNGSEGTDLQAIDPETGDEQTVFTVPVEAGIVSVWATPRVGFDGRVFLSWSPAGDHDIVRFTVYPFNLESDTELQAAEITSGLPEDYSATQLSPSETHVAAVYSDQLNQDGRADQFAIWDLQGDSIVAQEPVDGSRSFGAVAYASPFDDEGELWASNFNIRWVSPTCARATSYLVDRSTGERVNPQIHELCIPTE